MSANSLAWFVLYELSYRLASSTFFSLTQGEFVLVKIRFRIGGAPTWWPAT